VPGEDVDHPEVRQQVTGEGVAPDDHPGPAPDRDDGAHRRHQPRRVRPRRSGRPKPRRVARAEQVAHPGQRVERLRHRGRRGHLHRDARRAQRRDVLLAVLLGVGEHQVGP
jgi:hypothetical protein